MSNRYRQSDKYTQRAANTAITAPAEHALATIETLRSLSVPLSDLAILATKRAHLDEGDELRRSDHFVVAPRVVKAMSRAGLSAPAEEVEPSLLREAAHAFAAAEDVPLEEIEPAYRLLIRQGDGVPWTARWRPTWPFSIPLR